MKSISLQLCVNMWIQLYYPAWGLLQFQIWKIFSLCSSDIAASHFLFYCSWERHLDLCLASSSPHAPVSQAFICENPRRLGLKFFLQRKSVICFYHPPGVLSTLACFELISC